MSEGRWGTIEELREDYRANGLGEKVYALLFDIALLVSKRLPLAGGGYVQSLHTSRNPLPDDEPLDQVHELVNDFYEEHLVPVEKYKRLAEKKFKVVTQMGNQGHSHPDSRRLVELIQGGVLGQVKEVHVWTDRPIWPQGIDRPTGQASTPGTLNWQLWLGPAANRPYQPDYAPFKWRGFWDLQASPECSCPSKRAVGLAAKI